MEEDKLYKNYYVYGLVDPNELPSMEGTTLEERLGSIFYVGKGVGLRSEQHVKDALWFLEKVDTENIYVGEKLSYIINVLKSGKQIESIKLMAGFQDEQDAYRAEAFAIEAVNALRSALGRSRLTNAIKGHGVAIESFDNYANRMQTEEIYLPMDSEYLSIFVKGNNKDLTSSIDEFCLAEESEYVGLFKDASKHIKVNTSSIDGDTRPGWDPQVPWNEQQARDRARRYWPIDKEQVKKWITNPARAPKYLFLGIEEFGKTVVRYVFEIDSKGTWEYYPESHRWGIPLGKNIEHPYLNKILIEESTGKHVLTWRANGIRYGNF